MGPRIGNTSTFDSNTLVATGGNGGGRGATHTGVPANPAGNAGSSSGATSLLANAPSGAGVRVSGVVNNNTGGAGGNAGAGGGAGSIDIYAIF